MASDRIFGLVVSLVALAYIASSMQIETSFLSDPVGPKSFPIGIGIVAVISGIFMVLKPDAEPNWPSVNRLFAIGFAIVVLVVYALSIRPLGFLIPTAIAAGILSYQISPNTKIAIISGLGLSVGLFIVFKFLLGLGLVGFPRWLMG